MRFYTVNFGILIVCTDPNNFYECKEQCIIGVNMTNMYKLIKTMGNSDILTLFLEKNNNNKKWGLQENERNSKLI